MTIQLGEPKKNDKISATFLVNDRKERDCRFWSQTWLAIHHFDHRHKGHLRL